MKVLVLGGTVFLGRHLARAALDRGHHVTLFHRGRHPWQADDLSADARSRVDEIAGDRRGGLDRLAGRRWDAVIDPSGFFPDDVAASARALANAVGHYTFVSSISACASFEPIGITEDGPALVLSDDERREGQTLDRENPAHLERFGALYGALKVACEQEAETPLPGRALVVRPGLIVGPHDPTDRFSYWPERVAAGGDVLVPGRAQRHVQFIDVRDLAEWMIRLAEERRTGTLHATGPASPLTMGALLETCRAESNSDARWVWRDDESLLAAGLLPWRDLPLWIPASDTSMRGFMSLDCGRAIAAGLRFRPLADTVRDTRLWAATRSPAEPRRAGITRDRERELLAGVAVNPRAAESPSG